jgi:homoserine O-succinyltransferase
MPIKVPDELPARRILNQENVFIMNESRASSQDIRPLRIAVLNLMPNKIETETQLLRFLGNTPLQVELELLQPATYKSKNTSEEHLLKFYKTFEDVKDEKFDGLIITGAPVEKMFFEDVDYWEELCAVMEWSKTNVFSTLHICWAAQAALYYHYKVPKYEENEKIFGVFEHTATENNHYLLYGFDDIFHVPHSRYTGISKEEIQKIPEISVLSTSNDAGIYIVGSRDERQFFITGHPEYDKNTLKNEYERDLKTGLNTAIPRNYFPNDDASKEPICCWRSNSGLLFSNWLNYFVYQETPFDYVNDLKNKEK